MLRAVEKDQRYVAGELDTKFGDPYILGTPGPDSRPYHPTRLSREFSAFCKMNGFHLTFHDLRHTFATMMIAGGTDVRTVASYLGHSNVAMTLNTYAEVDPDAKRAAVSKVDETFDIDLTGIFAEPGRTRSESGRSPRGTSQNPVCSASSSRCRALSLCAGPVAVAAGCGGIVTPPST